MRPALDSHLNPEVAQRPEGFCFLEDSPMNRISPKARQATRRWIRAEHRGPRSGPEVFCFLEDSPGSKISAEGGDWLAALDDFRNWLARDAA
jgi:hypothetical protein